MTAISSTIQDLFSQLGIPAGVHASTSTGLTWKAGSGDSVFSIQSPIDGSPIGQVKGASKADFDSVLQTADAAYKVWSAIPAPRRGEIIRQYGEVLRQYKLPLGQLVSIEMGKIVQEGLGEVQEMIDICDFAVGLSRQLYGLSMHSERKEHRMMEQWHPLGTVGIISAFNFPVAVWAWNAALAAVCGNVCVWKPSEKTPFTAIACQRLLEKVLKDNQLPEGVFSLVIGDATIGQAMASDPRVALVSATGSTRMGKAVAVTVAQRLGKSLLELGGNNAVIIAEDSNLDMAIRSTVFGAVGTCGQRCTSTRRLIVHSSRYEEVKNRMVEAYKKLPIGNPLDENYLVGPLVDKAAESAFFNALEKVQAEGGKLIIGGEKVETGLQGCYVKPAIVEAENHYHMVQEETFAPILYLLKYDGDVDNAIAIQNNVRQGLSSSIFTNRLQEAERFLNWRGSDCGIANVNIGTSGAEIGGAFGGEKETGGGRESGSDAWRSYMRRQTNTINYSKELPLAQGIKFDI
ncbi:MAG TPA: aldehyde dehydrogenase family protein [Catalimonadaceae bacterium]|nr:aldehyde dehydrogenase family protein [Catalimonadaceae bacterium]